MNTLETVARAIYAAYLKGSSWDGLFAIPQQSWDELTDRQRNIALMQAEVAIETYVSIPKSHPEITPDMIEAGLRELHFFDPSEDAPETWSEIVAEIYTAMRLLAPTQWQNRFP